MASDEQNDAIETFLSGHHVLLDAPPGTGKSWTLVEVSKRLCQTTTAEHKILMIAYNTELAAELAELLSDEGLSDRVECYTFHGLCSHLVELTMDDAALERCLDDMDAGFKMPRRYVEPTALLLDEAQDITSLHLRLLRTLTRGRPRLFVVGDPRQRLYDFGRFPSIEGHFDAPEVTFGPIASNDGSAIDDTRSWVCKQLTLSRRITIPMAQVVDRFFQSGLQSAVPLTAQTVPVHVHFHKKWDLGELFHNIIKGARVATTYDHITLMAATKRGNIPLRNALNTLSSKGIPMYVQGVDGNHPSVRACKVRVLSYHAAKGTECDTAIVLVPPDAKKNPLYVALTRAKRMLHIVFIHGEAHAGLLATLRACYAHGTVRHMEDGFWEEATPSSPSSPRLVEGTSAKRSRPTSLDIERQLRSIDNITLLEKHRTLQTIVGTLPSSRSSFDVDEGPSINAHDEFVVGVYRGYEDVSEIYARAVRMLCEYTHSGRIRAIDDILTPTRLDVSERERAIRVGHMARFVSPAARDTSLLANDCVRQVRHAYTSSAPKTMRDFCVFAAATLSWDSYHHIMRQVIPVDAWMDAQVFERAVHVVHDQIGIDCLKSARYDVRLRGEYAGVLLHGRVHIFTVESAWHIVWSEPNAHHMDEATVRAILHPSRTCRILSLCTGTVAIVKTPRPDDAILALLPRNDDTAT